MSEQQKHIDDFFRDKVGGHIEAPPPGAWKNLEQRLDSAVTPGSVVSHYKWLRYGVIVSSVAVLVYFASRKLMNTSDPNPIPDRQLAVNNAEQKPEVANGNAVAVDYNQQNTATKDLTNNKTTEAQKDNNTTKDNKARAANDHQANGSNVNERAYNERNNNVQPANANHAAATLSSRMKKGDVQGFAGKSGNTEEYNRSSSKTVNNAQAGRGGNAGSQPTNAAKSSNSNSGSLQAGNAGNKAAATAAPQPAGKVAANAATGNVQQQMNPAAKIDAEAKQNPKANEAVNKELPKMEEPKKPKVYYPLVVESGIKVGYELGFRHFAANKYVIAPYIAYSKGRFGVMVQPTFKLARMNHTSNLGDPSIYYNVTRQPFYTKTFDTIYSQTNTREWTHHYNEAHDSITVRHRVATKSFTELEIPVLLSYKVSKNLSVYGGVLANYTTIAQIQEDKFIANVSKDTAITQTFAASGPLPDVPNPNTVFNYDGIAYAAYTTKGYDNVSSSKLAMGYMLGFTYTFKGKYTVDVSMLQNISNMGYIPNEQIRGIYTQPYFRLSAGYKFFQETKKKNKKISRKN